MTEAQIPLVVDHAPDAEAVVLTDETMRREAWSRDGGRTWEGLNISQVLPDGGGYGRGYGMKGGLTRLPVKDRDILVFNFLIPNN